MGIACFSTQKEQKNTKCDTEPTPISDTPVLRSDRKEYYHLITPDNHCVDTKKYNDLQHELSECKHKMTDLETKNKELQQTLNKILCAPLPHHNWDSQKICDWITNLDNGAFHCYKDALLPNLKNEQISGADLRQLDSTDLQRLGITSFVHQKIICSHLKTLTQNDMVRSYTFDPVLPHTIKTPKVSNTSQISQPYNQRMVTGHSSMDFEDIRLKLSTDSLYSTKSGHLCSPETSDGVVFVNVIKVTNMQNMSETAELYIELECNEQKERTEVVKNCVSVWNQKFPLFSDDAKNDSLAVIVWCKRKWTFDEKIGMVCIPVQTVKTAGSVNKAYDIMECKYGGKLHLELSYKQLLN